MKPSWKFVSVAVVAGWVSGALLQPAIAASALPAIAVSFVFVSVVAIYCLVLGVLGSFYESEEEKTRQEKKGEE